MGLFGSIHPAKALASGKGLVASKVSDPRLPHLEVALAMGRPFREASRAALVNVLLDKKDV
jgi:hypothetical protein